MLLAGTLPPAGHAISCLLPPFAYQNCIPHAPPHSAPSSRLPHSHALHHCIQTHGAHGLSNHISSGRRLGRILYGPAHSSTATLSSPDHFVSHIRPLDTSKAGCIGKFGAILSSPSRMNRSYLSGHANGQSVVLASPRAGYWDHESDTSRNSDGTLGAIPSPSLASLRRCIHSPRTSPSYTCAMCPHPHKAAHVYSLRSTPIPASSSAATRCFSSIRSLALYSPRCP
ncbi:hypothetical protein GY45DRAFT_446380 [Cubamyces sp. BRFM 1775]|nr:hypothetical protein GY45DRAFT_446380 [Cubamyces sp. BRFM 1775]